MNIIDVFHLAGTYVSVLRPYSFITIPVHKSNRITDTYYLNFYTGVNALPPLHLPKIEITSTKFETLGYVSNDAKNFFDMLRGVK